MDTIPPFFKKKAVSPAGGTAFFLRGYENYEEIILSRISSSF
jgi:hypothetical protein